MAQSSFALNFLLAHSSCLEIFLAALGLPSITELETQAVFKPK